MLTNKQDVKPPLDLRSSIEDSINESKENNSRFLHNSATTNPDDLQPYQNQALLRLIRCIETKLGT